MSFKPAKILQINLLITGVNASWSYDDGTGDPWIGNPVRWNANITVSQAQVHSSHQTREPYTYNALDIGVGDMLTTQSGGRFLKVLEITTVTDAYHISAVLEDIDRENTFQADDQVGQGVGYVADGSGLLFEVKDGRPILFPMPSLPSSLREFFLAEVITRFFLTKRHEEVEVDQAAHGFAVGDAIYLAADGYHKAQANSTPTSLVIGVVTSIGRGNPAASPSGWDRFTYRPVGPVISGISMPTGDVGGYVYLSDSAAGGLTMSKPSLAVPIFIKLGSDSGVLTSGASTGGSAGGMAFRGDWSSSTAYSIGDIVNYNGVAYAAVTGSTAVEPPNIASWGALGGGLGAPETGSDFTNGLFDDFAQDTRLGIAVDRFNRVLKSLGPKECPNLDDIEDTTTHSDYNGVGGKLSFGTSGGIAGYTNVDAVGGLSAVDRNGLYAQSSSADNNRIGIFNATTPIVTRLAGDIVADPNGSFPAYSFGKAEKGSLLLFVNNESTELLSVDLSSDLGSLTVSTANGSNITVSAAQDCLFPNGDPLALFKYRTGSVTVGVGDQRNGWNWLRVVHRIGAVDLETNYIEWAVDDDTTVIGLASHDFTLVGGKSIAGSGLYSLTGVRYFTGGSATFNAVVTNAYRNTFSAVSDAVFSSNTNGTNFSLPLADIVTDEGDYASFSQGVTVNVPKLLNGAVTVRPRVRHPLLAPVDLTADSTDNILLFNMTPSSSYLDEDFRGEYYRVEWDDFPDQPSINDIGFGSFNSQAKRMADADNTRCLVQYDEALCSPSVVGAHAMPYAGNFTLIAVTPDDNADYSALPETTLFYLRKIFNDAQGSWSNFTLSLFGSATLVTDASSLNDNGGVNNNVLVEIKMPEQIGSNAHAGTGWLTFAPPSSGGCLVGTLTSSISSSGAKNWGTMGTVFCASGESMVVRLTAHSRWTGFISALQFRWGLQ